METSRFLQKSAINGDGVEDACLDQHARSALIWVDRHFLHPRLGLPYDYFSPAGGCPRRAFGIARDIRQNLPNRHGFGAGFALSCQNLALLLDAVLLRLELGIAVDAEENLAERLADGLARLAAAPRHALVRGLAGDGQACYGGIDAAVTTAFAFGAWRILASPALAPERQEKFRPVAIAWIERVEQEKFRIATPGNSAFSDGDLTAPPDALRGPWYLALAAFAQWLAPKPERARRLADAAAENDFARLGTPVPAAGSASGPADSAARIADSPMDVDELVDPWTGLWRQIARRLAYALDADRERRDRWRAALEAVGARMAAGAGALLDGFTPEMFPELPDFEWRRASRPADGPGFRDAGAPGAGGWSERRTGFTQPASWARLAHESATLRAGLSRMLGLAFAFAPDDQLVVKPRKGEAGNAAAKAVRGDIDPEASVKPFSALPARAAWNQTVTCAAPALALTLHARGVEQGWWDAGLPDARRIASAKEESLTARFLEADYDERHPERSGHGDPDPDPETEKTDNGAHGDSRRHRRPRRRRRR